MLFSTGSSDKSGSNEDGSSVFDHFVVSGLIKFKQKIGGRGKSYVQRKLVVMGG